MIPDCRQAVMSEVTAIPPTGSAHLTGLDLPYRTPLLPGIGGRIRAEAQDFRVTEIPAYPPCGQGPHVYINLSRAGMTTLEVAARLARSLDVPRAVVGYAGLKDKQALTTQTFSIGLEDRDPQLCAQLPARLEDEHPFQVHWVQRHTNRLKPGHLHGNRFAILIRDTALPLSEAAAQAARIGQHLRTHGLANFFGPQRFGHNGYNVVQGWHILHEGVQTHPKWRRRFFLSAYQSYLCNQYLAWRQADMGLDVMLAGDIARKHGTGGMFVVTDPVQDTARLQAGEISFTAPMFGYRMWEAEGPALQGENNILAQAGVCRQDWRHQRVRGTRRMGRVLVPDLTVTESDSGVQLAFTLPKGSFATVVLREIMKNDFQDMATE